MFKPFLKRHAAPSLPWLRLQCLVVSLLTLLTMSAQSFASPTPASQSPLVSYPTKSIRMVVGFPPGGGNDAMARLFGQHLSEHSNQAVVIDNRPGAGGNLAAELVSKAPADGYTLLLVSSSHPIQGLLKKHLNYDPIKDFSSVAQLVHYRSVLVVHPSVGVHSLRELMQKARAQPGQINFVSPGNGTGGHLAGELFRFMTGLQIVHIPYKGTALATTDLMGGRVQMMFTPTLAVAQYVASGRLKALAVTSRTHSRVMPELPTLAEAGVPQYEFAAWYAMLGPAHLPKKIVMRVYEDTREALKTANVKERLQAEDLDAAQSSPHELDAQRRAELAKWTEITKKLDTKFD